MDELWTAYAIKYAERNTRTRHESFILDDDHSSPHDMDYFLWVLTTEKRTILVDTGYDHAEGEKRGRPILRNPAKALKTLGIDADSVETLIITHAHYDHAGGLDLFPNATIHIQQSEMSYVTGACMCHQHLRKAFSADHVCQLVRRLYSGRVVFHDGDGQIAPGVTVHRIGGHTAGLQVVRVKTGSGWLCLASDASHYYENFLAGKPFPIVFDLKEMLEGFQRLTTLATSPSLIVPGHDPLIFRYFDPCENLPAFVRRVDRGPNREIQLTEVVNAAGLHR